MPLIVATMLAMQPVYNAARAAHALRSDQLSEIARTLIGKIFRQLGVIKQKWALQKMTFRFLSFRVIA